MKRAVFSGQRLMLLGGVGLLAMSLGSQSAQAQSQFCPGDFEGGTCIVGAQGAVSTAALSSQALSDASQNVTQASNDQSVSSVRRRLEQERSAPAQQQQQTAAPARAAPGAAAPRRAAAPAPRAPSRDLKSPDMMVVKAAPVMSYGPTYGFWTHAYGDWERWKGDTVGIRTLGSDPTNISMERKTTTFGVLGGADVTYRGAGSTWVFGVLAGYMDSKVKFNSTSVGNAADNSTISNVKADITGPTIGAYLTFATGPWSFDVTGKADFLTIDQSFTEILFVNAAPVTNAGAASVDVTNLSVTANANYRIPTSASSWWEPTVGFRYTHSDFGSNAAVLGMTDGDVFRVQGGIRLGADYYWYNTQVVATLTGLLYSDVSISGLVLNAGGFGGAVVPDDEGKLRAMGILALSFNHSQNMSTLIQAEVRGGEDLFGVGGKVGFRVNW